MTVAIYLPLILGLPLLLTARWIAERGAPGPAARGLAAVAAIAALSSTWSLILLALTLLDDVPPLAALDANPALDLPEPVPGPIALIAAVLLAGGGFRLLRDLRRRLGTHRELRAAGVPEAGLVVADWETPLAVAVPGRPGHLLVTTGILRALDDDERRVLFAHERAHLSHHHHRLVTLTAAAAALNPLLIPVREAVAYLVERWADEDAATTVGDRDLTAQAVARAALATVTPAPPATLGMTGGTAVHRVEALAMPAPARRGRRLVGPLLIATGCLAAITVATVEFVAVARAWL
jgi:Zn-dependent protease with chaperone function